MTTAICGSSIPAILAPINIIVATPITNKLIPHIKLIFFDSIILTPLYSSSTITPPSTKRTKYMEPFCSAQRGEERYVRADRIKTLALGEVTHEPSVHYVFIRAGARL